MSKHGTPKAKAATVAPPGVRLSGPGTRSKNPRRYDNNAHMAKGYVAPTGHTRHDEDRY